MRIGRRLHLDSCLKLPPPTHETNEQLIMKVTTQQEQLNEKESELQRLRASLTQHNIAHNNSTVDEDRQDDLHATATGMLTTGLQPAAPGLLDSSLLTPSMPTLTPFTPSAVPGGGRPLPAHTALPVQPQLSGSVVGGGSSTNASVVYYIPTTDSSKNEAVQISDLDKSLKDRFKGSGPKGNEDITCDPLPQPLADTLNVWFCQIFTNEEICTLLLEARRPVNVDALLPIQINKEVYKSLSRDEKEKDRPLKCIANAICKASQAISAVWASMLKAEVAVQAHQKDSNLNVELTLPDGSTFKLSECIAQLTLGLKLLGIGNVQISQKRRLDLKYKLALSARELAGKSQPFTSQLFGDNIKEDHATAIKNYQLTQSVTRNRNFNRPRNRHDHSRQPPRTGGGWNSGHSSRRSGYSSPYWGGSRPSKPGYSNTFSSGRGNNKPPAPPKNGSGGWAPKAGSRRY